MPVTLHAPGVYLLEPAVGRILPAIYARVHGVAACGGPYLDVTFNITGKPVRRVVRVAVNGSWRCGSTFLPLNALGETFQ